MSTAFGQVKFELRIKQVPLYLQNVAFQLVLGLPGADPGFWSGWPSGVLTPEGGAESKICSKWGFPLSLASKLHDFEKNLGGPLDPQVG